MNDAGLKWRLFINFYRRRKMDFMAESFTEVAEVQQYWKDAHWVLSPKWTGTVCRRQLRKQIGVKGL